MKSAKQTILAYMLLESTVFEKYRITFGAAHLLQIFIFALPSIAYHSVGTSKWLPKKILKTHIYAFEILILTLLLLYVFSGFWESTDKQNILYLVIITWCTSEKANWIESNQNQCNLCKNVKQPREKKLEMAICFFMIRHIWVWKYEAFLNDWTLCVAE